MKPGPFLVMLALAGMLSAAQAQTAQDDRYPSWSNRMQGYQPKKEWRWKAPRKRSVSFAERPRAWCGWWLGQHLGMPDRRLWVARNWASIGRSASGPGIGVIVVWRHHVGIITGRSASGWIVKSGNDGNAVRERPRSLARAIAYRTSS